MRCGHVAHVHDRQQAGRNDRHQAPQDRAREGRRLTQVRVVRSPDHPGIRDDDWRTLILKLARHLLGLGLSARVCAARVTDRRIAIEHPARRQQRHIA